MSFQQHLSVGNRAAAKNPSRLCLFTSRTTTSKSVESGRSFSSPSAPFCWKSTWTWSLVTATEVLGANQLVTTHNPTSILEEAFADTDFPIPPGHTPLWGPGAVPSEWTDVCGVVKPADSCDKWRFACMELSLFRETLGLRPRDKVAIMRYGCTWTLSAINLLMSHEEKHEQRVLLQEKSCPYLPNKGKGRYDDESDRSLSSLSSVRERMLPYAVCMTRQGPHLVNGRGLVSCFIACHTAPCAYVSCEKKDGELSPIRAHCRGCSRSDTDVHIVRYTPISLFDQVYQVMRLTLRLRLGMNGRFLGVLFNRKRIHGTKAVKKA